MKLHLGVTDLPYATGKATSTGDVAEYLEDKYHIMAVFYAEHAALINAAIEAAMVDSLEDAMAGGPGEPNMQAAESAIETMFRAFISRRGMDGKAPGVPTQASLRGVSHRRKHPYAQGNPMRPSFVDTGQYVASFKAWTEGGFSMPPQRPTGAGAGTVREGEGGAAGAAENAFADAAEAL